MLDTQDQLARLRQRIAAIETRSLVRDARPNPASVRVAAESCLEGSVVTNEHGAHFETEHLFAGHKQHGNADVGALCEMPHDLLDALGGGECPACPPERWAFLDTETTGLAGGSGTCAFLIGVGRITTDGFRVKQFFLRDFAEERSTLTALAEHLSGFDVMVTYNGRSYDQPLLETRFCMMRERHPFARLAHLDLLHGARRLWKMRLENCKLTRLEQQILGYERQDDVPGSMIPALYFDYLRHGQAQRLLPVFHHNALDILTLACLTAIVPAAFRSHDCDALVKLGFRHGPDLAGIARWLLTENEPLRALAVFERAIDAGLPDACLFRCLWEVARLNKKLDRPYAAVAGFTELSNCRNEFRGPALEELAKFYEHKEKNFALALDLTCEALRYGHSPALELRKARLESRLAARPGRQTAMRI